MRLDLSRYLVTDPGLCARRGVIETVMAAVDGGVTVVQLRDKTASDAMLVPLALRLKTYLAPRGIPLIINDRIDVALASGADGLHVGQGDMDVGEARRRLPADALLGLSIETLDQMTGVDPSVVDYIGAGPIFATTTKPDHAPPIGLDGLSGIVAVSPVPVVAIGGLDARHVSAVRATGAAGLAVVSAICAAPDVTAAAKAFRVSAP
jgi:thiamine-phosphate pyrophosphorylase